MKLVARPYRDQTDLTPMRQLLVNAFRRLRPVVKFLTYFAGYRLVNVIVGKA